jgi:hypothetical protein
MNILFNRISVLHKTFCLLGTLVLFLSFPHTWWEVCRAIVLSISMMGDVRVGEWGGCLLPVNSFSVFWLIDVCFRDILLCVQFMVIISITVVKKTTCCGCLFLSLLKLYPYCTIIIHTPGYTLLCQS